MSISSSVGRNDYVGNGSVDTYDYDFKIFDEDHLLVVVRNPDTDVETTLTISTDYTVTGVNAAAGGTVVLVDANQAWIDADGDLDTDWVITIKRVVPITQVTDIRNQGDFYPETHEDQFDKQVMIALQQQDDLDRAMKLPVSITEADFSLELPTTITDSDAAGKFLGINATYDGIELFEANEVANPSSQGSFDVTDGQAAANLTGISFDGAVYSSIVFMYEITRGTTVFSTGDFSLHYRNATWYLVMGSERREDAAPEHGVTFSVTQATTTVQLRAALDSGAGNGTIKLRSYSFS